MKKLYLFILIAMFSFAVSANAGMFDWLFQKSQPQEQTFGGSYLQVYQGGTGWNNILSNTILLGNGTNRFSTTTQGTNGQVLMLSNGIPTWAATTSSGGTGGVGIGTISTSTAPTQGGLSYWTTSGAWPELLGSVATNTLTASLPLSLTQPISVIGSSASVLSLSTAGDWGGTFDSQEGSYYLNAGNLTNFGSPFWTYFSATNTTALSEGTNLYWTAGRFDNRLSATSSVSGIFDLPNLSRIGTTTGITYLNGGQIIATSTIGANLFNRTGDWTGTFDNQEGSYYLDSRNQLYTGTSTLPQLSITKSQISDLGTLFTQAMASTTFVARNDWTTIDNYPTGCTNQFIRTIGDTLTCASVANTDLVSSTISGVSLGSNLFALTNDSTLNGSSYNGSSAISDWGLNLANPNTWTGLQQFANASSTQFTTDGNTYLAVSSGNVGIGTTGPASKLEVTGDIAINTGYLVMPNGGYFIKQKDAAGTARGLIGFDTSDNLQIYNNTGADGGNIIFANKTGTAESVRIDSSGNVGIGTTAPGAALDVASAPAGEAQIRVISNSGTSVSYGGVQVRNKLGRAAYLTTGDASYTPATYYAKADWITLAGSAELGIRFGANARLDDMVISTTGNVGIGTTTPASKLAVSGNFYLDGGTATMARLVATSTAVIPYSVTKTLSETGEIGIDTTSGQFKWYDANKTQIITGTTTKSFYVGSTTPDSTGKNFNQGTTTFKTVYPEAMTMSAFRCKTDNNCLVVRYGDGTNFTTEGKMCTSGTVVVPASNNTWTAWEDMDIEIGSATTTPNVIWCTGVFNRTAD